MHLIPDKKSGLLYLWTVFFFSLFSAIPVLSRHSFGLFFKSWLINLLIFAVVIAIGALIIREVKKRGWLAGSSCRISDRICFWICLAVLMLCTLPYFLAFFPGTIGADYGPQLDAFKGVIPLTRHHPIFHTMIVGLLYNFGRLVFQNGSVGAMLYIIFQIVFCNYAIARLLLFLKRRRVPLWLLLLILLYYGLNPMIQILLCYSTKDIPFAAALLLYVMFSIAYLYPKKGESKSRALAGMIVWGILSALLRNQGNLMILLVLLSVLLVWRKRVTKKRNRLWAMSQVLILVISLLFGSWIPGMMGIPAGDMREMLSVPSQQIAKTLVESEHTDTPLLSEEQKALAWTYYGDFTTEQYNPLSADPNKDELNSEKIRKNPLEFLKVWTTSVFADFRQAVLVWTDLILPYFGNDQSVYFTGMNTVYSYPDSLERWGIQENPLLPGLRDVFKNLTVSAYQQAHPWTFMLLMPQVSLYVMIYMIGYGWIKRRYSALFSASYGFIYFLSLLLGPVALSRYEFVLVMQMLLWIGILNIEAHPEKEREL